MNATDDTIAALDRAISSRSPFHVGLYKDQLRMHTQDAARRRDWRTVARIQSDIVRLNRRLEAENMAPIELADL